MGKSRILRPSRREALGLIGLGASAGALSAGCGLGPVRCGGGPGPKLESQSAALAGVDALVVVMLENRSFDHLLGGLRADPDYPGRDRVDGLRGDESNLDVDGRPVLVHRMDGSGRGNISPAHRWDLVRETWNDGRLDGFLKVNGGPFRAEVMSHLVRDQIPFLYSLADQFTVCDRWFASFPGPTWPNRAFLHATSSGGRRANDPFGFDTPPNVWDRLAERCLRGKNYGAGPLLWYTLAFPTRALSGNDSMMPASLDEFFDDAHAGNLPELSIVDPEFKVADGSPMHELALAEAFVAAVCRAMFESPQWSRSLLVVTFDEHGGYYDHVPPPKVDDPQPNFRQLGFRVPTIVVGPSVQAGAVVSTTFEHVSVAATLGRRFGLQSLGPRMDAATDLSSCLDPTLRRTAPIAALPTVELPSALTIAPPADAVPDPELQAALASGRVPANRIDPRSPTERMASWLRRAQELDAVKIIR
jgi:phospholipase C